MIVDAPTSSSSLFAECGVFLSVFRVISVWALFLGYQHVSYIVASMALALPEVTLISDDTDLIANVKIVPSITPILYKSGRSPVGDS